MKANHHPKERLFSPFRSQVLCPCIWQVKNLSSSNNSKTFFWRPRPQLKKKYIYIYMCMYVHILERRKSKKNPNSISKYHKISPCTCSIRFQVLLQRTQVFKKITMRGKQEVTWLLKSSEINLIWVENFSLEKLDKENLLLFNMICMGLNGFVILVLFLCFFFLGFETIIQRKEQNAELS